MQRLFLGVALVVLLGGGLLGFSSKATAAEIPEGILPGCATTGNSTDLTKCEQWWSRRSRKQQEWLTALPVPDRYHGVVCMFLTGHPTNDPQALETLSNCTHSNIVNRRSMHHCEAEGHELLSVPMANCQKAWIAQHGESHRP